MGTMSPEEKKELEGIKYLKEHNDMSDTAVALRVYNRLVEENVFKTKVGMAYLKELQAMLLGNNIERKLIKPIPIIALDEENETNVDIIDITENKSSYEKKVRKSSNNQINVSEKQVRQLPIMKKEKDEKEKYKNLLMHSVILNVVLIITVIVMLYIASSGSNPTILNYEEKLIDKYSSWDEQLKEKENELNQWERELEEREESVE